MLNHEKQQLRQQWITWRKALSEEVQIQAAQQLLTAFWQKCDLHGDNDPQQMYIGFYMAIGGEVPTDVLLQDCLQRGAHCFLPVIADDREDKLLQYREVTQNSELVPGAWGAHIPKVGIMRPAHTLTHLLVPALAVTAEGARLGFGAGYFDATLHEARVHATVLPQCWGVVYRDQCVDTLPQAPWDELLDAVICVG